MGSNEPKFICAVITSLSSTSFTFCVNRKNGITLNRDTPSSFSRFTQKVKLLELRDVITAQINLHIPVRLSPRTSLYDLQKSRYVFISGRPIELPVKKAWPGANVKVPPNQKSLISWVSVA